MNRWIGSGRLTDDPVIRYSENKAPFATFTVMCVRSGKIPEGAQAVDFIDCKCSGHNFNFAKDHLRKGKKVEIVGTLQSGSYKDADGRKIYTKTVYVHDISFGETKEERTREEKKPPTPAAAEFMEIPEGADGDFPFA